MPNTENTTSSLPTADVNGVILSLLVAADEGDVIGANNQLPWHLPNDLKYFKNLTWGLPIVMGRKTFESIGKPLQGRTNIVITRNTTYKKEGVAVVHTIEEALQAAREAGARVVFIIGGAEIFNSVFNKADRIYITRIHHRFSGDVYFPEINRNQWQLVKEQHGRQDEKNKYAHTFQVWERKAASALL